MSLEPSKEATMDRSEAGCSFESPFTKKIQSFNQQINKNSSRGIIPGKEKKDITRKVPNIKITKYPMKTNLAFGVALEPFMKFEQKQLNSSKLQ